MQPQTRESTIWEGVPLLHAGRHVETCVGVLSCSEMIEWKRQKDFYWKPMPINIVTEALEKENTRYQRKLKIVTSAISAYTSRLMCLKIKSQNTTKSVCPTCVRGCCKHSRDESSLL